MAHVHDTSLPTMSMPVGALPVSVGELSGDPATNG